MMKIVDQPTGRAEKGEEDLRPVDGEAVEERVGGEREQGAEQPTPPERTGCGMQSNRRPGDHRGRHDEHREGMGIAALPGEGGDPVGDRTGDVEIQEEAAESSRRYRRRAPSR